ncbi:MAG TPA: hypothetical protein VGO73_06710 [Pyrinomonadaceae bacterium]|jgi:hypothetical protein|nr:hypothetical protein [Pyrinomonadaceae bacterium]
MADKTLADVFDGILSERRKFLSFVGLFFSLCLILVLIGSLLPSILGINTKDIRELNISSSGAHILLESVTDKSREYIVIVPPQGWQRSGIELARGERVRFIAEGAVNVDLWGVMQKATKRHEVEDRITLARQLDRQSTDPKSVPEHYFSTDLSKEEQEQLKLLRPWTGPNGNEEIKVYQNAFAARITKRIIPTAPLGALIGAVTDKIDKPPERQEAFLIGKNYKGEEFHSQRDGELWFNVNDVWDDEDAAYPNKFYDDNVGYYWVKVLITPSR